MTVTYDEDTLRRFFTLTPDDLTLVRTARGDHNRLGLALLLVWTRVERVIVSNLATLPAAVVAHVGRQLGLTSAALQGYGQRPATHSAHAGLVCAHLRVRPFAARDERGLRAYLHGKAAHTGNTAALLDAAAEWVVREGLLRPLGETTLERIVYDARADRLRGPGRSRRGPLRTDRRPTGAGGVHAPRRRVRDRRGCECHGDPGGAVHPALRAGDPHRVHTTGGRAGRPPRTP